MAKLLVALIAFATLGYLGYWALQRTAPASAEDQVSHAPKRQLDNVHQKADELERQTEQKFQELDRKTTGE